MPRTGRVKLSVEGGEVYYRVALQRAARWGEARGCDETVMLERSYRVREDSGHVRETTDDGVLQVNQGEVIEVSVLLATTTPRRGVVVEAPLLAGVTVLGEVNAHKETPWHVAKRRDRLLLVSDDVPAGVHKYTYRVRATHPGSFRVDAVKMRDAATDTVGCKQVGLRRLEVLRTAPD